MFTLEIDSAFNIIETNKTCSKKLTKRLHMMLSYCVWQITPYHLLLKSTVRSQPSCGTSVPSNSGVSNIQEPSFSRQTATLRSMRNIFSSSGFFME